MADQSFDNRRYKAMSADEADALFLAIAKRKAALERKGAAYKARLAKLEEEFLADTRADRDAYNNLSAELMAYIIANPERFVKPRKRRVGGIGSYGITTDPAIVNIIDKDTVIQFALDNGYDDIVRVSREPVKDAILRRNMDGEAVPGVRITPPGDVAKLTFKANFAELLEEGV